MSGEPVVIICCRCVVDEVTRVSDEKVGCGGEVSVPSVP